MQIIGKLRQVQEKVVRDVGDFFVGKVKEAISTPFPPASEPGDAPHARSYMLWESIHWRIVDDSRGKRIQVGSVLPYAYFLEMGTISMEPRPFLLCTIVANMGEGRKMVQSIRVAA